MTDYDKIALQAEADLNTYQAKMGAARPQGLDDASVNSMAEKKFDSAKVSYGDELSTSGSYNKRIPLNEGGMLDDRGRQSRGKHFAGRGGPVDKLDATGDNDDVVAARVPRVQGLGGVTDIATQGKEATWNNVGDKPAGPGGLAFRGDDYYTPESVPDSISAEGLGGASERDGSEQGERRIPVRGGRRRWPRNGVGVVGNKEDGTGHHDSRHTWDGWFN